MIHDAVKGEATTKVASVSLLFHPFPPLSLSFSLELFQLRRSNNDALVRDSGAIAVENESENRLRDKRRPLPLVCPISIITCTRGSHLSLRVYQSLTSDFIATEEEKGNSEPETLAVRAYRTAKSIRSDELNAAFGE